LLLLGFSLEMLFDFAGGLAMLRLEGKMESSVKALYGTVFWRCR
jgi:hypothetical protein